MKRIVSTIVAFAAAVMIFGAPWSSNYARSLEAEEFNETVEYTSNEAARSAISSGTYFISNVQFDKVVQIDDNVSPSTSGAILELWNNDKGTDQQWKVSRLYNGYFYIRSVASDLAITAPRSANAALTLTAYTGADEQQWQITLTSDKMFKLSPKSNPSYFMSAGSGAFTADGRNVEMRSNQSDNKDEWYFLDTRRKFTQATVDYYYASSFNKAVKQSYEKNAHAYGTTYDGINKAYFLSELKGSNYFGAMLHGRTNELLLHNGEIVTTSDISNIPNSSFDKVKIVILTSCYAGMEFVDLLHSKGVRVVIGFVADLEQETAAYWTEQLIASLSEGNTVREALDSADKALKGEFYQKDEDHKKFVDLILYNKYTGDSYLDYSPCDDNNL